MIDSAFIPWSCQTYEGLDDVGDEYLRRMVQSIPMARLGDPQDVANAIRTFGFRERAVNGGPISAARKAP